MRSLRPYFVLFPILGLLATTASAQIPVIRNGGIVNGASFEPGQPIAAGSLITIFGDALSTQTAQADTIPLSATLAGVSVNFINASGSSLAAPMLFVYPGDAASNAPTQLNVQVPWDILPPGASGTVNVVVTRNGQTSQSVPVSIGQFSPGIFASNGRAIAVNNTDGTLAWPAGLIQGLTTHPAKPGDALIVYATGLGPLLEGPPANGQNSLDLLRHTATTPIALIGGISAQVLFSGLTPQFVGVNQVNVVVPPNAPAGDAVPIQLQLGGITSTDKTTIAITR
jgi:uncharacterized protein (TIGR03437 family)